MRREEDEIFSVFSELGFNSQSNIHSFLANSEELCLSPADQFFLNRLTSTLQPTWESIREAFLLERLYLYNRTGHLQLSSYQFKKLVFRYLSWEQGLSCPSSIFRQAMFSDLNVHHRAKVLYKVFFKHYLLVFDHLDKTMQSGYGQLREIRGHEAIVSRLSEQAVERLSAIQQLAVKAQAPSESGIAKTELKPANIDRLMQTPSDIIRKRLLDHDVFIAAIQHYTQQIFPELSQFIDDKLKKECRENPFLRNELMIHSEKLIVRYRHMLEKVYDMVA